MANDIDILINDGNEELSQSLNEFIDFVLDTLKIDNWSFSVTLTNDAEIAELNSKWRNKEGSTDVLTFVMDEEDSFPHPQGINEVGDIVISLERVAQQSGQYDQSPEKELKRVLVHGILHLKGMTHQENDWSSGMLKLQEDILKKGEDLVISGWDHGIV